MKHKLKLAFILGVEFIAIAIVLILIFFSGKKQYTVTFDLNGGTLVSGSLEQSVTQGHNATPPSAVKEGHFLRGWSGSYKGVTHNTRVTAIWEYETTPGIEYTTKDGATYTEISGCYKNLAGKLYIGAYKNDLIVFGILDGAFENCKKITDIHLLDGILTIGSRAFAGCSAMTEIDLPNTATIIESEAFADCSSLKSITLPRDLQTLGANAFQGCDSLEEVYIPSTVEFISESAFEGLTSLKSVIFYDNEEKTEDLTEQEENEEREEEEETEEETAEEPKEPRAPTVIGKRAFAGCSALESVSFVNAPISIGAEAFADCTSLSYVIIPEQIVSIAGGAFNTEGLNVYLYFTEEQGVPEGFDSDWHDTSVNVIFGYNGEQIPENNDSSDENEEGEENAQ